MVMQLLRTQNQSLLEVGMEIMFLTFLNTKVYLVLIMDGHNFHLVQTFHSTLKHMVQLSKQILKSLLV